MERHNAALACELEYVHQALEVHGQGGLQVWLDRFVFALNRSRFSLCEQLLTEARRSNAFADAEQRAAIVAHNEGLLRVGQARWDEAETCYQRALSLYQQLDDRYNMAQMLNNLGEIHRVRGRYDEAIRYYTASQRAHEELGNSKGLAQVHNNLGLAYQSKGDWADAEGCFERALALFTQAGNEVETARALNNLARLYRDRGEWERALGYAQDTVQRFRQLGDRYGLSTALSNLGALHRERGDHDPHPDRRRVSRGRLGAVRVQGCLCDRYERADQGNLFLSL